MSHNKIAIALLLLSIQSAFVVADLPIHCLKSQVTGKWILKEGKILAQQNNEAISCGHQIPDKEASSYKAMGGVLAEIENEVEFTLEKDFTVKGKHGTGKWTLVYDEGWEIEYNKTKYFHFFKYVKNDMGEFKSDCSATLVGWFNKVQLQSRGCSQAFKVDSEGGELTENVQQAHVVQPKDQVFSQVSSNEEAKKAQNQSSKRHHQAKFSTKQSIYLNNQENVFAQMPQNKGTGLNHDEITRRLNSIEGKTWEAKTPSFLQTMTLEKMNKRAGIRQNKPAFEFDHSTGSFVQTASSLRGTVNTSTDYTRFAREDVSHLPKEFNWEAFLHTPRSQEDCGSCYAIATSAMLSSRLWIKYGDNTEISPQHSLACNYYNQGCDGGYGFLVSKYFSEFEAVPESCHPYQGIDGVCGACDVNTLNTVYTVSDYEYIGGSYGKSTEKLMMEEMMKNGPIVVSFAPTMEFMYYSKGVYHSVDANKWIQNNEEKPIWQKVDHSVLCYGWGEDENGKFWLIQNSWGEEWGENGNFRMRRGTDESNIESMGERASIDKKSRNTYTSFAAKAKKHDKKKYQI